MSSLTRFRLLFVAAMVICLFSTVASAQQITHFTFASHGPSWSSALEALAEDFYFDTGIWVNVVQSSGQYDEAVLVRIAGGVAPDVTDFNPEIAGTLIATNLFEDLRPYVDRSGIDLSQYPPVAIEGMTAPDGTLWGFPMNLNPIMTYFNDDLFQQAGLTNPIDLGDDWTWETFAESARRLTIDHTGDGQPDQWGVERLTFRWEQWVHQAGGQWFDRLVFPTESYFTSDVVIDTVRFLADLTLNDGIVAPETAAHMFRSGQGTVAMTTVDGPGIIGSFLQGVFFDWDIARQPKGPVNRSARVNPDGFQILKDSANKEAAWKWIEYLVSNVENQYAFAATTGRMPSHREAMFRYPDIPIDFPSNWMALIDTVFDPDGYAAYVVSSNMRHTINSMMNDVWKGIRPPEEVLAQMHDIVSSMIAEGM